MTSHERIHGLIRLCLILLALAALAVVVAQHLAAVVGFLIGALLILLILKQYWPTGRRPY